MDFLTKIWNFIKVKLIGEPKTDTIKKTNSKKQPIFNNKKNTTQPNEITMIRDITDEQIEANKVRARYVTSTKNPNYKIKSGDSIEKIAEKFGVETRSILVKNNLTPETAKKIRAGQILKIPNTRKVKNVRNLNDVAKSMGVSLDFVKKLKMAEDGNNMPLNKFHNTPYTDDAGVKTIGIGHVVKKKDSQNLSNAEVCHLLAKDLLKAEENFVAVLGSQKAYDRIPQGLKEAVLDLTFNKGIVNDESFKKLVYCLRNQKWEASINQLVFNKSTTTKKEMSGLNKRRLFDISLATKIYANNIPKSNRNTAQTLYNRGVELLRQECKRSGNNFKNILVGYNKDIQQYFKNGLKLEYITE